MKKINRFLLVIYLAATVTGAISQDIHFSQFYETPLLINPALTGAFNGDVRAIINYKNQWKSISNPYRTEMFSFDAGILKKKWSRTHLSTGILIYNDKAGKSKFGTTQVNLALSATVSLNDKNAVSAGLLGGIAQKGIKNTDLKWGNQYDETSSAYNPNAASGEEGVLNADPSIYGDFGAGLNWSFINKPANMTSNDKFTVNVGAGFFHINKPSQKFYAGDIENLYTKLVIHGKSYIGLKNKSIAIVPGFMFLKQKTAQEINAGALIRYSLKEESKYTGFVKESAFYLGGYFRVGDAFIPTVAFEIANFSVGLNYDINISNLKTASNGKGGFEISLRYINPNPFSYTKKGGAMF